MKFVRFLLMSLLILTLSPALATAGHPTSPFAGKWTFTVNPAGGAPIHFAMSVAKNGVVTITGSEPLRGSPKPAVGKFKGSIDSNGILRGTFTPKSRFNWNMYSMSLRGDHAEIGIEVAPLDTGVYLAVGVIAVRAP